jgi:hypothetical protein
VLVGILVLWFLVPVLAVIGFLGWGTVAAEGPWRVVFALGFVAVITVTWKWVARLRRERDGASPDSPI